MKNFDLNAYKLMSQELEDRIGEIFKKYADAYYIGRTGYGTPSDKVVGCDYWHWDEDGVVVFWSEHWAYGGYDSGDFFVPIKYLLDNDALNEYVNSMTNKHNEIQNKKLAAEKERIELEERELLANLKEKYKEKD